MDWSAQQAKYGALNSGGQRTAPAQSTQKVGGLKGFATNLLPLILGGGGALAGSIAGPLGTAGGGAAGSAAGEALKEKLTGQKLSAKSIGIQGALGAVPGVFEGAGAAIKAGRAGESVVGSLVGKGAAKVAGEEAVANAVDKPAGFKLGRTVANKGSSLEAKAGGFNVGQKAGAGVMMPGDVQEAEQWLASKGVSGGSAESRLAAVNNIKSDALTGLNKAVSESSAVVTNAERQRLADNIMASASKVAGPGQKQALKDAAAYIKDVEAADTPQKLLDLKRAADTNINFNAKSASVAPETQQIAKAVRTHVNETLNNIVPEAVTHNTDYSMAKQLEQQLAGAAKNPKGLKIPLTGVNVGGKTAQAAGSVVGKFGQKAGAALAGEGGAVSQVAAPLAKATLAQGVTRGVVGSLTAPNQTQVQPNSGATSLENILNAPSTATSKDSTASGSPFNENAIQAAILKDIAQNGGKNTSQLVSLYNTFGKPDKVSATQQANSDNVGLAGAALKSISQAYDIAGGGQGAPGLATHIPIAGQYLAPKAAAYNQTKIETATQLAKALTGSTRPASTVIEYYLHSLPNIEDRPEVAAQKLIFLQNDLKNRAASVNQSSDSSGSGINMSQLSALVGAQ